MSLFTEHKQTKDYRPLAERQRPKVSSDFCGQVELWEEGSKLRLLVETAQLRSVIFWGPPGSGKTTVAELAAVYAKTKVCRLSAISAGVKELRAVIAESKVEIQNGQSPILLFLDEVHRLNKNQQDILLPSLETGEIRFIGATTENPSFAVNNAINSRCLVFCFKPLDISSCELLVKRAMTHDSLLQQYVFDHDVSHYVAQICGGDARQALTLLETVIVGKTVSSNITQNDFVGLEESMSSTYDRQGDAHYDTASALIKSIRGSQPDAALHYLARMIEAGEKPEFIARRLVISASEDIGNANPHMLTFATSALQSVKLVGMPEARIMLGQITTLLAASPKSNRAYLAVDRALSDVRRHKNLEIPFSLRNAPTDMMKKMGYGKDYVYAHDDPIAAKKMTYLPKKLVKSKYYEPSSNGYEAQIKKSLD